MQPSATLRRSHFPNPKSFASANSATRPNYQGIFAPAKTVVNSFQRSSASGRGAGDGVEKLCLQPLTIGASSYLPPLSVFVTSYSGGTRASYAYFPATAGLLNHSTRPKPTTATHTLTRAAEVFNLVAAEPGPDGGINDCDHGEVRCAQSRRCRHCPATR